MRTTSIDSRRSLKRIVCALAITAFAATGLPAVAAGVTVAVDGQPLYLNPGPIERAGRVFVPLRSIFERLGASVVYQNGQINSTKGNTNVSLTIGSQQATVNGQPQVLDVAPFIVGATTYVPLRFVAQSLGAVVDYNGNTQVVAITAPGGGGGSRGGGYIPPRPRPPYPPPPPPPAIHVQLRNQQPSPGSTVDNRFAVISANFSPEVEASSVRVRLDGNAITGRAGLWAGGFSYKPPAPLEFGSHTVRVDGRARGGSPFDRSWSFTVRRSAPVQISLTINQPNQSSAVGRTFIVSGSTAPNASINVTAGAAQGGAGLFNGNTTAGPRGNFQISVTLKPLMGQQAVFVRITATDPSSSLTAQKSLQLRFTNAVTTQ